MNISENPALDQLAQFCQEIGNSVSSVEQLGSILLSAVPSAQETSYNTEALVAFAKSLASQTNKIDSEPNAKVLEKILLIWNQALAMSDDEQISIDEAEDVLKEAKPFLPPEITRAVNYELETTKSTSNKIVKTIFVKILELIIIPIAVNFISNQITTKDHDCHNCKEEAHCAVVEQNQNCSTNSEYFADSQSEVFDEAVHIADSSIDSSDSEAERNN